MWRTAFLVLLVGCGSVKDKPADAAIDTAAAIDAPGEAGCQPEPLLVGGSDVAAQGWAIVMQPPATVSNGPDFVHLQTSTQPNQQVSGQLLLNYPGALDVGKPFKIQVVMLVEQVNPHNSFDSAAAIMGSYGGGFGLGDDRSEMIFLDAGTLGWADDTQSFNAQIVNNAFHTYELAVDAAGNATVTIDGTTALTRSGFTFNGAIAIGDQTNDANVDSSLRIRSVTKLCP